MLLEAERLPALMEDFDKVLFADDVVLRDITPDYWWSTLQGPAAGDVMSAFVSASGGTWPDAETSSVHSLAGSAPDGSLAFARSLTGDSGFVLALPRHDDSSIEAEQALEKRAAEGGFERLREPELSRVLELLRIEAGIVRIGPDTLGRKRILPETGLEQQTVSYTKGCYLGQEVIARVRTYGALPFGLRALVVDAANGDEPDWAAMASLLESIPEPGADVLLENGKSVGQLASRTLSPVANGGLVLAYLDKKHRTPGSELVFQASGRLLGAKVVLLPIYSAPGREERVAYLYDRAVRTFAEGRETAALALVEEALRVDPAFADGYEALGVMLGRSERFHEAIDIFKRLEEIAPQEPMVNTNLSLYYMKIGEKESAEDEAAKAMQKSMAQSSGRAVDGESMEAVMAEQKRSDALRKKEMFAQVLEIDSEDPVALFGLGNALAVLEEWEEAARLYAAACEAQKDNSAVYLARGKVLEQLGLRPEAETVYRAGMEVASRKGDLMPLKEMAHRVLLLSTRESTSDGSAGRGPA